MDGNLGQVEAAVDHLRDEIGDRWSGGARLHPRPPGSLVAAEDVQGERLVLGDRRHADLAEEPPGGAFDVLEYGKLVEGGHANAHPIIVAGVAAPEQPQAAPADFDTEVINARRLDSPHEFRVSACGE
jgi:hypothetical protein